MSDARMLWAATLLSATTLVASCTADPTPSESTSARLVQLDMLPPIAQRGSEVSASASADSVMVASFDPASPGQDALLQRQEGSAWVMVDSGAQDNVGAVTFTAPSTWKGAPAVYRAVTSENGEAAPVTSNATATDAWSSKFTDEFDGGALNTDRWNFRQLGILSSESSRTYAQSSEDAVRVADGSLRLMVKEDPEKSGYYLNGHIGTQDTFSFRYGVAAARVKFQEPRGQHGAFWIQTPTGTAEPGNPEVSGAEIDVAEFFGRGYPKGGLAHFSYHYNADEEWERVGDVMPSANKALVGDDAWWKNYHVFSVEWTPGQYIFRIDGVETYRSTRGVSGRSEYLILSLLTSDWELPKLDENKLPSTMHVDWVRVWQQ